MEEVPRRATFLLLILVLLVAPAANAWCSTICLATAISSGCAHGLQPADDLPMEKAIPAVSVAWTPFDLATNTPSRASTHDVPAPLARTPLRL